MVGLSVSVELILQQRQCNLPLGPKCGQDGNTIMLSAMNLCVIDVHRVSSTRYSEYWSIVKELKYKNMHEIIRTTTQNHKYVESLNDRDMGQGIDTGHSGNAAVNTLFGKLIQAHN